MARLTITISFFALCCAAYVLSMDFNNLVPNTGNIPGLNSMGNSGRGNNQGNNNRGNRNNGNNQGNGNRRNRNRQNQPGPGPNRNGARRNGGFDVSTVLNTIFRAGVPGISSPEQIRDKSKQGRKKFSRNDNVVRGNSVDQNARSIFAQGNNNEFVNREDAAEAAFRNEDLAARIVEQTGVSAEESFAADGTPNNENEQVSEVVAKAGAANKCIFEKANTDPCTSKFREPTARCSHLEEGRRTWGMASTPYTRVVPSKYEDGISAHRITEFSSGNPLKSARKISDTVTNTVVLLHQDFSAQLMQWGQFIAHEFTLLGEIEENVECCPDKIFIDRNGNTTAPTRTQLEEIREEIKELRGHICIATENFDDSVFGEYICMHQTRSTNSPNHDCTPGPRQQLNAITHVFDASAVYGSSQEEQDLLRGSGGKMKVQVVNNHILPPPDNKKCRARPQPVAGQCPFMGGDNRINTTPNLAASHGMFLVLHNKFVDRLSSINPHWNGERLFQETRRIIAGIQSAIHYHEYLPIVLGEAMFTKWIGGYKGYNKEINPSVLNELAGAAMRYGHSIIDGIFFTVDDNGQRGFNNLEANFFNHDLVYDKGMTQHLRGLQLIAPWKSDNHFPSEMRDKLFKQKRDIVSLNINRGRDHGFASYNDYRRFYNLPVATTWDEMKRTHPEDVVNNLRQVYTTPEDCELFICGVTENPVAGGIVGDTFANIIGHGFANIRDGDRLFYASPENGLTPAQINALEHFPLAQVLCEGGLLTETSKRAFFQPNSPKSQNVNCSSFPALDLNLWHEEEVVEKCEWQVVDISNCCNGQRTVTRECRGEPASANCNNKCSGEAQLRERCSCPNNDWRCFYESFQCENSQGANPWDFNFNFNLPCTRWNGFGFDCK